ncbi:recombinase family protein [Flavobacterium capsici]|uniref:Recombinase family protein n=1 Tax=Flavobacterium capsici TaxID=3075618 RepID=A0AA96J8Q8_9FLAO|nr:MULTISPECIES: recombinase family protein [unclassified Flavobacterium]WNM18630.1 recombinase family protein [Flavobacterium sp. PMR2A8]WNM22681.1 recombinase family protein [Flavobacterium sp. PMTSA4]
MKARYIRISSGTQSTLRQLAKQHPEEKLFIDVISGSIPFVERPQAKELFWNCVNNNVESISVSSVDRLGRNAFDIQQTIDYLNHKKINLIIDNLGISSFVNGKPNSIFKMITDVLANVAQMERDSIRERQAEGIAIAKAQGKFSGKRNKPSMSDADIIAKYKEVAKELKAGKNSLRKIAKIADVSLGTVQKVKEAMDNISKEKGVN